MTSRPIIFSSAMVTAILEGRKTQTRRIAKNCGTSTVVHCPYGVPGDRLYVKEPFSHYGNSQKGLGTVFGLVKYEADGANRECGSWPSFSAAPTRSCWKRSRSPNQLARFMPRWASRLTLEVVSVRVERLQEITEEDAKAEGAPAHVVQILGETPYRGAFALLWDELNQKRGPWAANPFVWVVAFKRVTE